MVSVAVMKELGRLLHAIRNPAAAAATGPSNLIHIVVFRPA